jgi:hypothetical protein
MGDLMLRLARGRIQLRRPGTLDKSAQQSAAAQRFAVTLAEGQSLLVEPVGILLGENDIGLKVHANLLIAGGGAIVKLYNRTTTHLLSGSSRLPHGYAGAADITAQVCRKTSSFPATNVPLSSWLSNSKRTRTHRARAPNRR